MPGRLRASMLAFGFVVAGAPIASAQTGPSASPSHAVVVFAGDVVPHQRVLDAFDAHHDAMFDLVRDVVSRADLAIVNLEAPAVDSRNVTSAPMQFNVHSDFVQALARAGFDGIVLANNHALDAGVAGVDESVRDVRAAGVQAIGAALAGDDPLAPIEFALAGRTLCVIAATQLINVPFTPARGAPAPVALARPHVSGEREALLASVRAARSHCGALIVSLHAGVEYSATPDRQERALFPQLAEAGADAVIAHHPHTVQPVVRVTTSDGRVVPLFYSIGNFVSNQGGRAETGTMTPGANISLDPRTREGLLAVLRFEPDGARLRLASWGWMPLWTLHHGPHRGRAPDIRPALMPRDGGNDPFLRERWNAVVSAAGDGLLDVGEVDGAAESVQASGVALEQ